MSPPHKIITMAKRWTPSPVYFETAADLRRWFQKNHDTAPELWVGLYKAGAGKRSVTRQEMVDEALCFGWIDGITQRIDADRYTLRLTPRRPRSHWSAINIRRVAELERLRRMRQPGRAAFAARDTTRASPYSYEADTPAAFDRAQLAQFRAHPAAWAFFRAQPPSYQRVMTAWVAAAKKEETRARRLGKLIALCEAGKRMV
jgi:uncharacterized protein YdeI (YjbR/CyaY-like superfamily)